MQSIVSREIPKKRLIRFEVTLTRKGGPYESSGAFKCCAGIHRTAYEGRYPYGRYSYVLLLLQVLFGKAFP